MFIFFHNYNELLKYRNIIALSILLIISLQYLLYFFVDFQIITINYNFYA